MEEWYLDGNSECATRSVQIRAGLQKDIEISFDAVQCDAPVQGIYEHFTGDVGSISGYVWPEFVTPFSPVYTNVADYWILPSEQSTESFLLQLIAALPLPEQRQYCRWEHDIAADRFYITPSDYYPSDWNEPANGYCRYDGYGYFIRKDRVLLYVHPGQDTPSFDPDSFDARTISKS